MSDLYSFSCSFKANSMINWDHTLPSSADSKKTQKKVTVVKFDSLKQCLGGKGAVSSFNL